MGVFKTLPEFYLPYLEEPIKLPSVNYSLVFNKFAAVFGRDAITLVSYNNLLDHGANVATHFVEKILDWHGDASVNEGWLQRNISPSAVDTEILRALNYLHFLATGATSLRMRVLFLTLRQTLNTDLLADVMKSSLFELPLSDAAAPFQAAYAATSVWADRLVSKEYR